MSENKNYCEYIYRPEKTAKMTAARIALLAMYTVFCTLYILLFWLTVQSLALLILLPFLMFAMIRMTWRLVNTEYEVSVEAGELAVAVIYGKAGRKTKFRFTIREMMAIVPYDKEHAHIFEAKNITDTKLYGKSLGSENALVCICPDIKKSAVIAVVFEADDEVKRLLRLSNPSAYSA